MSESFKLAVDELRPTQFCLGLSEVAMKTAELEEDRKSERHTYLQQHPIPVVLGPSGAWFLIDHHHLARALHDGGHPHAWAVQQADLSALPAAEFWPAMHACHWVYAFERGEPRPYAELPLHVARMSDDPYRSIAGLAREAGAFHKDKTPFVEFVWANFFRSRIVIAAHDAHYREALAAACKLAQSPEARGLPGYHGASG